MRDGSRTAATFKMELFEIIVNGFQALTIIKECSILDVAAVLDLSLQIKYFCIVYKLYQSNKHIKMCITRRINKIRCPT